MNYVYIGKIVNTHGIKGELRIISDFDKKELIFKPNFKIYIGKEKIEETIRTYRHHKNFEMITLENFDNINEVLLYLKQNVYINRDDLHLNEKDYLLSDLIGCVIIENEKTFGKVEEVVYNKANILLKVINQEKHFYIPNNKEYIKEVNIEKKQIITQNIQGLIL